MDEMEDALELSELEEELSLSLSELEEEELSLLLSELEDEPYIG